VTSQITKHIRIFNFVIRLMMHRVRRYSLKVRFRCILHIKQSDIRGHISYEQVPNSYTCRAWCIYIELCSPDKLQKVNV